MLSLWLILMSSSTLQLKGRTFFPSPELFIIVGVIVVGKEGRGKNRWRTQYVPNVNLIENELPQEIADQHGGWYFLRIYDNRDDLLESLLDEIVNKNNIGS